VHQKYSALLNDRLGLVFCSEIDVSDARLINKRYVVYAVMGMTTCLFNNQIAFFPFYLGR
jgi:hypothetical protein